MNVKRVLMLVLSFIFFLSCTYQKMSNNNWQYQIDKYKNSVVKIHVTYVNEFFDIFDDQPQIKTFFGTGFVIVSDGTILTAKHLFEGKHKDLILVGAVVEFPNKTKYKVTQILQHEKHDVAILKIESKKFQQFRFEKMSKMKTGDEILVLGFPGGYFFSVNEGIISVLSKMCHQRNDYPRGFTLTAAINPGNSGGPIINSNGNVVGMSIGYMGKFSDLYTAIPSYCLIQYIAEIMHDNDEIYY